MEQFVASQVSIGHEVAIVGSEMRQNLSHCALPLWALMSLARHRRLLVRRLTQLRGATLGSGLLCIIRVEDPFSSTVILLALDPQRPGVQINFQSLRTPFSPNSKQITTVTAGTSSFSEDPRGSLECISSKKRGQDPE